MATSSQSQNRCVFVGNIPYDATEEQLIQICEEVGPVVSFRLVIDRETGKPKGYGFCEYKDEETALSARRNLQGYAINGRQLRVDFAESGKNAERNRDQGNAGPGVVSNIDNQKHFGLPAALLSLHQPMGDSVAMAAATVVSGALGSGQTSSTLNQTGLRTDYLTPHLAKMSKSQLTEIMSELKEMATKNKDRARQLLLAVPSLPRALFQAQVMLGMVSPQMMQNIRQPSTQPPQPLSHSAQPLPGLPPLPQNKMQSSVLPYARESQVSAGVSKQYGALEQFSTDSKSRRSQLMPNQVFQQAEKPPQSGVSAVPSIYSKTTAGLSFGSQIDMPTSSSSNKQMQLPLSQSVGSVSHINSGYNDRLMSQNAGSHHSAVLHPQFSAAGVQPNSSTILEKMNPKGRDASFRGKTTVVNGTDQMDRASKMVKLNDGRALPLTQGVSIAPPVPSHPTLGIPGKQVAKAKESLKPEKQATPVQLPPDVDSTLLQQVMNLTPEQLSSLPPDQQQQVIQLQRMLRQAT